MLARYRVRVIDRLYGPMMPIIIGNGLTLKQASRIATDWHRKHATDTVRIPGKQLSALAYSKPRIIRAD